MRHIEDHHSGDLFDPWGFMGEGCRQRLERSWAGLFRQHCLGVLPVYRVAQRLSPGQGRPSKDLYVMLGALILQQVFDLTDSQAISELNFDAMWHYALDIRRRADAETCERTLRSYRLRLIEDGLDELVFASITDQLVKVFKVDATHQRLDSTALRSAMRRLGRLGIFTETIEDFLRQLRQAHRELHESLDEELRQRYADGGQEMCFGLAGKPSQAAGHLQQAAEDLLLLVRRFAGTEAATLPAYGLLKRILQEQCVLAGDGDKPVLKEAGDVSGSSLQNPSDPDATYNAHKGQGYTLQVMETYQPRKPEESEPRNSGDQDGQAEQDKPDLVTHVSLVTMTAHDQAALAGAIEDTQARGVGPRQVLGDTHYGVGDNIQQAAAAGVELVAPAPPPKGYKRQKLSLEDFVLNNQGLVERCPAGQAPISTSATDSNYQARFDAGVCAACPLQNRCPVQKPRSSDRQATRLQYDRQRLQMRERRRAETSGEFRSRYRWRAGIEATMSRLKHEVGLGALRVRTWLKVKYEAFMSALALNIRRCAACW